MKKIYLLLFIFFSVGVKGQFISIPDTSAYWHEVHWGGGDCQGYVSNHDKLFTNGPPVYAYGYKYINLRKQTYQRLCADGGGGQYFYSTSLSYLDAGYFRNDTTGKVFWRLTLTSTEIVLYDFSLQVGDSLNHTSYIITRIDTQTINGVSRRMYRITKFPENAYAGTIIEGIGSDQGFLIAGQMPYLMFEGGNNLICMGAADTTLYGSCPLNTGIHGSAIATPQFSISPNPATNSITITTDESMVGGTVSVSDVMGRRILMSNIEHRIMNIELKDVAAGVYFVSVTASDGRSAARKLVVSK